MGGVIGEGQEGGSELNVRSNDGRMLWMDEMGMVRWITVANTPFELAGPRAMRVCAVPVVP
jgi:hypothetical protein